MTLSIDFTPQEESWLQEQAAQQGISPAELIRRLVDERLPEPLKADSSEQPEVVDPKRAAAIALLESWIAEGASADEETRRQAEQEVEELKRNLNANRAATGERLVFP